MLNCLYGKGTVIHLWLGEAISCSYYRSNKMSFTNNLQLTEWLIYSAFENAPTSIFCSMFLKMVFFDHSILHFWVYIDTDTSASTIIKT